VFLTAAVLFGVAAVAVLALVSDHPVRERPTSRHAGGDA
jgi:hypothetical protein